MRGYNAFIPLDVDIEPHPETKSATVTGRAGRWHFRAGRRVSFRGLNICFMIVEVHPNGMTMINSLTSIQAFYSWSLLFDSKKNTIWLDCINHTGWLEVK